MKMKPLFLTRLALLLAIPLFSSVVFAYQHCQINTPGGNIICINDKAKSSSPCSKIVWKDQESYFDIINFSPANAVDYFQLKGGDRQNNVRVKSEYFGKINCARHQINATTGGSTLKEKNCSRVKVIQCT